MRQDAETIARKAMKIAAEICVYTNDQVTVETTQQRAASIRDFLLPVKPARPLTANSTLLGPINGANPDLDAWWGLICLRVGWTSSPWSSWRRGLQRAADKRLDLRGR